MDSLLADPKQVDIQFDKLIAERGADDAVLESMRSIKHETKIAMLRQQMQILQERDPNREAAVPVPARSHKQAAPRPVEADLSPLKRKASKPRITTLASLKRQKLFFRRKDNKSKPSTQTSVLVPETVVELAKPLSGRQSVKSFLTGSNPRPSADGKDDLGMMASIAKDDGDSEVPLSNDIEKDDAIVTPRPADRHVLVDNFVHNIKYMREYFSPGYEPSAKSLGNAEFKEQLTQLLAFVRGERASTVKKFCDEAIEPLMDAITALADKEFRPMEESVTLRLLLKVMDAVVGLPSIGSTGVHHEDTKAFDQMFKALVEMMFSHGEERRGFANFQDRCLVIDMMSHWVTSSNSNSRRTGDRARFCLSHFRDPVENKTHDFVKAMQKSRPYTRWYTELKNSTEGFGGVPWIFYNKGNKLTLPQVTTTTATSSGSYYEEYRPGRGSRPDKSAFTTAGHTETQLVCYIAQTINFLTTMITSVEVEERKRFRRDLRDSRFDELFLSKFIRASKLNFFVIHEALECWYTAALADNELPVDKEFRV